MNNNIIEEFFCFLKNKTGLNFQSTKLPLLENRLRKRMESMGLHLVEDYFQFVLDNPDELEKCLPLLTTHKTEWFREIVHFQWIQNEVFPKQKSFRIWSAACSSGEEVFSLLFLAIKNNINPKNIKILGTDISPLVLEQAKKLPHKEGFKKQLYFLEKKMERKILDTDIQEYLKRSVDFKIFNLMNAGIIDPIPFDLIVIRNVFIYFDFETIDQVVLNLLKSLKKGGHLIIGLSETIDFRKFNLINLGNGIFRYDGT